MKKRHAMGRMITVRMDERFAKRLDRIAQLEERKLADSVRRILIRAVDAEEPQAAK